MTQPAPQGRGVSVVVVTYNSAEHLPGLVESLAEGLAGVGEWELVVADNDSSDGSAELVTHLDPSAVVVRMGRNAGYAAAINAATARGREDFDTLVLNPDVRLGPHCVRRLQEILRERGPGIAVPRLVDEHGKTWASVRRDPSPLRAWGEALLGGRFSGVCGVSETVTVDATYEDVTTVDWATGAVLLVAAEVRRVVGPWDERYFLYSEEVDYFQRARDAGFRATYVPGAVAFHAQGEYQSNAALWRLLLANRVIHFARRNGAARTAVFRAGLALGELIRTPRGPAHRAGLRGLIAPHAFAGRPPLSVSDSDGVVWFAAQDWWYHNQAHSDFQLMQHAARDRPVLVVNSLGMRVPRKGVSAAPWQRIARKLRSTAKLLRRPDPDNPNYYVMSPVFLPVYGDSLLARLSSWMVRQQVRAAGYLVGLGRRPAVVVTIPTAWPAAARLRRSALVFNRSDRHSEFPEADGELIRRLEEELLERSDAVLYVSHELMRLDAERVGDRAYFLDHGVDVEHFTPAGNGLPVDLASVPHPRIGFFGALDDFVVDMDLFRETALALPHVNLVLIGDATCDMEDLVALPNVHWLGFRSYRSIPAYGRGFDVAVMPWLDNEWIRFANPIKLKEYLALGLTVVSTEYPEIEDYRDRVHVAPRRADFPATVEHALRHRFDPDALRASVVSSSWGAKTRELLDLLDRTARGRRPAAAQRPRQAEPVSRRR